MNIVPASRQCPLGPSLVGRFGPGVCVKVCVFQLLGTVLATLTCVVRSGSHTPHKNTTPTICMTVSRIRTSNQSRPSLCLPHLSLFSRGVGSE